MINDADISENQLLYSYGEKVCMNLLKDHTTSRISTGQQIRMLTTEMILLSLHLSRSTR